MCVLTKMSDTYCRVDFGFILSSSEGRDLSGVTSCRQGSGIQGRGEYILL